jgi:hypothetical protein
MVVLFKSVLLLLQLAVFAQSYSCEKIPEGMKFDCFSEICRQHSRFNQTLCEVNFEENDLAFSAICEVVKDLLEDSAFYECFPLSKLNSVMDVVAVFGWAYLAVRTVVKSTCPGITGDKAAPLRSCLQRFLLSDWTILLATIPSVVICIGDLSGVSFSLWASCVAGGIPASLGGVQFLFDCWKVVKWSCRSVYSISGYCPACLSDNCCLTFLRNSFKSCADRWGKTALYEWWRDKESQRLVESEREYNNDLEKIKKRKNKFLMDSVDAVGL